MAIRKCPKCLAVVPPGETAANSDALVCPGCQGPLEVAGISRHVAIWPALAAGFGAWTLTTGDPGMLGWVKPVLYPFLAFSFTAGIITMFFADLRPREAAPEPVLDPGAGHGRSHH